MKPLTTTPAAQYPKQSKSGTTSAATTSAQFTTDQQQYEQGMAVNDSVIPRGIIPLKKRPNEPRTGTQRQDILHHVPCSRTVQKGV
jgi:hypothetical protein